MTRLLAVLDQGNRLPSGYIRGSIYRGLLERDGFEPRFVSRQMRVELTGMQSVANRFDRLATRINEKRIIRFARQADVIYLSKVFSYPFVRALRQASKARIVLDFCDAVWLMGGEAHGEFHEILRMVDAVTTDNEITAGYARPYNENCTVVPDSAQLEAFDRRRPELGRKPGGPIVLGWLGSPSTAFNLYEIWQALEELFRRHQNIHLRLVGTGRDMHLIPPFEKVRFSARSDYGQEEMIEEVFGMHVGLFPLQDVERCRVRGINKAAIYMSGQAAVVTSPVGQCIDFIRHGENGLLARTAAEWIDALDLLIRDAGLRERLAARGLETVRSSLRLEQSYERLRQVLIVKLVITGALGHIGSGFIRSLAPGDFDEVTLVDDLSSQRFGSLFDLQPGIRWRFVEGDVTDEKFALEPLLEGAGAVVHLAAITNAAASFEMAEHVERVNLAGTERIAIACAQSACRLFFPSTTSVYGVSSGVVDEACPPEALKPQSPYAESKLRAEAMLARYGASAGLRYFAGRLGTIFGASPGMRFHTAVNKFVWQACVGQPLTVWRTAMDQMRPYLDLRDAVAAILFVLREDLFDNQVYNILTGNLTVRQIIEAIRKHVGDPAIELVDTRIMNQLSYTVDRSKFESRGFRFCGDLDRGIGETVRHLRHLFHA